MSSNLRPSRSAEAPVATSAELSEAITQADFSGCAATIVGYGNMGRHFLKALQTLGIGRIRVCSASSTALKELDGASGVETVAAGFHDLECSPVPGELGIISTPTKLLASAARRLAALGFRRLLIEKPVSLWSGEIQELYRELDRQGVEAACGFNRIAYPSFHEIRARATQEGGITSCTYDFTELIGPDWVERFPAVELARWGVSNSLHVMSMAHGFIGMPGEWHGQRTGAISWHPAGAVFVGSGMSERGIPFAYHGDWGSMGRWVIELHTPVSSYRLCPIEQVQRKTAGLGEWEPVAVAAFAPELKAGIAEEVAAMLNPEVGGIVPLFSLVGTLSLTRYGEEIFGYTDQE